MEKEKAKNLNPADQKTSENQPFTNKDVAFAAKDPENFFQLPQALQENKDFLLSLVSKDPRRLWVVNKKFRDDKEIVLTAIKVCPTIFSIASARLRDDAELLKSVLFFNWNLLEYASERIRSDRNFVDCAWRDIGKNQGQEVSDLGIKDGQSLYFFRFIEDGVIRHHIYETHRRGRNWCSILHGKNSVKIEMEFLPVMYKSIEVSALKKGMAIEIGGDYISSGGNRSPNREQYTVEDVTEDGLMLKKWESRANAIKNRTYVENDT